MTWHSSFCVSAVADSSFPQCQRPNWPGGPDDDDEESDDLPIG